jgi:hypothetical protein
LARLDPETYSSKLKKRGRVLPAAALDKPIMDRPTCIGCGAHAPNTDTNYTLISATFGWRLSRRILPDGSRAAEWRCPSCWSAHKNPRAAAPVASTVPRGPGGPPPPRGRRGESSDPPPPLRDK